MRDDEKLLKEMLEREGPRRMLEMLCEVAMQLRDEAIGKPKKASQWQFNASRFKDFSHEVHP